MPLQQVIHELNLSASFHAVQHLISILLFFPDTESFGKKTSLEQVGLYRLAFCLSYSSASNVGQRWTDQITEICH